ncbi:ornithine cyclodeaminase family protein [Pseudarthrobacter sp. C1]|uniref:ornithine cyclodeaminase family protein n=1 Tax=Pseudarthrobacter sp. C1 TaxID=3108940 RepID=UPI002B05C8F5|nr:ornithine cyclodeaminase family protein [Pseudarthrobacter sp. C1]MEA3550988.1 ornithine cyclodeaminase family protein [Pseudarthrobacter sp. C1]
MTLILTASELHTLADMPRTIKAVESAFADISAGLAHQPAPASLSLPPSGGRFIPMSALSAADGLASVKLLADIPANSDRGLPTQRSTIVLVSRSTGETLAILDGRIPTRVRTAAASAVASKVLARSDSSVLGLVGAGALAVAHVHAMLAVLPIKTVVVWSRTAETTDAFQRQVADLELTVVVAASAQDVVESADVLCTLTPASEPVVFGKWFKPGLHVNAVGARPRPEDREIDSAGMVRSRVFVDSLPTATTKSGDLMIPVNEGVMSVGDVRGELGDVITGKVLGRTSRDDITLFNSVGIGVLDLAIGRILYDSAVEQSMGLELDLSR